MNLKYHTEITAIGCNLEPFQPRDRIAYRFVKADINDPENFMPVYELHDETERLRNDCRGWGFSLYDSEEKAQSKMMRMKKRRMKLAEKFPKIAHALLEEADGISCDSESDGHFTHFEYVGIDLSAKFSILINIVL